MSKLKHLAAIMAVGGALAATGAQASTLFFDFTGSSDHESWYQAVPSQVVSDRGASVAVSVFGASGTFGDLTFHGVATVTYDILNIDSSGGLGLFDGNALETFHGPQIYSGPLSAPVFSPTGGSPIALDGGYTLTITAVPEPAAWALMLTGVFGVGAVLRARRGHRLADA